ncbi:MAG: DUF3995 domain-containing protein [Pseudomonadales bacterium]|nr:DUF3995 domain-containing protein [Pseudomonadales bacterium]
MDANTASATGFLLLALGHSALGEARLLKDILANWSSETMPRSSAAVIIRSAWHALSVAWLGMAMLMLGLPTWTVVAIVVGLPGVFLLVSVPTHVAWGLMLATAITAYHAEIGIAATTLLLIARCTAFTVLLIAIWHIYWALGGQLWLNIAIPSGADGTPVFRPSRWLTACVGLVILAKAALLWFLTMQPTHTLAYWLVVCGILVFVARAVGDGKYVGFFKTERDTPFARADSRIFTPLVVLLALGSSSVLVGGGT